ncbi:hypothetical protein ON010_g18223 [Phytophthora cinnamomi]|nr:hypothetical protein ON010_g18223 [Phytophthora cinnamomi]
MCLTTLLLGLWQRQDSLPVTKIGTSVAMTSMESYFAKWLSRDDDSDDNDVEEDLLENLDEFTIWDSEDSV